jgi:hypothetical protein
LARGGERRHGVLSVQCHLPFQAGEGLPPGHVPAALDQISTSEYAVFPTPAYYQSGLGEFVSENPSAILWKLAQANAAARFPLTQQAIEAWHAQLPPLTAGISHLLRAYPEAHDWGILLEYPIPIIGKRIDAVLLARNLIVVIETKTGESSTSAARQVDDYALNLACFHEYSRHGPVVPLVVSNSHVSPNSVRTEFDSLIEPCRFASTSDLGQVLETLSREFINEHEPPILVSEWNLGRFKPIPPIIDAAIALHSGMNVFELIMRAPLARISTKQQMPWCKLSLMHESRKRKSFASQQECPGQARRWWASILCTERKSRRTAYSSRGTAPL